MVFSVLWTKQLSQRLVMGGRGQFIRFQLGFKMVCNWLVGSHPSRKKIKTHSNVFPSVVRSWLRETRSNETCANAQYKQIWTMPRAIHCTATSSDSCRTWFRVETPLMASPTALQPPVRGHHSRLVLLSWFHPRCATVGRQTPGNLAAWCHCHAGVGTRQLMVSFNLLVDCFVKLCWAHFVNIDVPDLSNCYQSQFGQLGMASIFSMRLRQTSSF